LRDAAAVAAKSAIKLVLENEMTCNTATAAEAAQVLAAIPDPNLLLNWDPGNAAAIGETPFPNGYRLLPKGRIGHCHCKDVTRKPDGSYEWAAMAAASSIGWGNSAPCARMAIASLQASKRTGTVAGRRRNQRGKAGRGCKSNWMRRKFCKRTIATIEIRQGSAPLMR